MEVIQKNKLTFLVGATFFAQVIVVASAFYLRSSSPTKVSADLAPVVKAPAVNTSSVQPINDATLSGDASSTVEASKEVVEVAPPAATELDSKTAMAALSSREVLPAGKVVVHTVKAGDTLTKIWTSHGGSYGGGVNAAKAFKEAGVSVSSPLGGEN